MFTINDTDGKWVAVSEQDTTNFIGKVLIMNPQFLREGYKKPEYQLIRVVSFDEGSADDFLGICCFGHEELTFRKACFFGVANADVEQYAAELEMAPIAYKQVYLPDYHMDCERSDCTPVCFKEFVDCEWSEPEVREYYLYQIHERMSANRTKKIEAEM